jgi:pimeloyl-ACP methyl ester carboxylesterase/membrane protein DedA with SNARE-associated domain
MAEDQKSGRKRGWLRGLLLGYLVILIASQMVWRFGTHAPRLREGSLTAELTEVDGEDLGTRKIRLAYRDLGSREPDAPTMVLLHGSPGTLQDFDSFASMLPPDLRVLVPDLPGFGGSERDIPDYSARAHGAYVVDWLDQLQVEQAHLVAFSMGGAVAAEIALLEPQRIASLSMVSALGTVELELFGDQDLNHLIHGAQLFGIEALRQLVPHFGGAQDWVLGIPYARNFYDTDQSRVRDGLSALEAPCLVIHGIEDFLVPIASARETARIVPQAELTEENTSHFLLWTQPERTANQVAQFVHRAEAGTALPRANATADRVAAAEEEFDPTTIPAASGPSLMVLVLLFIVGTFVSEDLTTIAAGLMVAQGRIAFLPAALACSVGVFVGDLGLFLAGRWLGRPVVERRPLSWFLSPASLDRASSWFERQGMKTIFLSRLMPGLRLPTYFAAGVLRTRFVTFALYFAISVLVWTPALVLVAVWIGEEAGAWIEHWGPWALVALIVGLVILERIVIRMFTFRGRRSLVGMWMRWTQWEFWPPWMFYPPIALYIVWLAIKHRSLALCTAVNPCMPTGGFIGEAKSEIMDGLDADLGLIARYRLLYATESTEARLANAVEFQKTLAVAFPIILKPEVGQRGSGVQLLRDASELEIAIAGMSVDHILQEYVPGPEYGVFYIRAAGEQKGKIFSITKKQIPELVGDGQHTLEELILLDKRSVAMASTYIELHSDRLHTVPEVGERIRLVELGTHCRGAVFLDGNHLKTDALEDVIDRLSQTCEGFHFGRYDLRAASEEDFVAGRNFKILELNGLTSEATHIYDPKTPLFEAWRVLCEQWRLAFEIAAANRDAGAPTDSVVSVLRELAAYRVKSRSHTN